MPTVAKTIIFETKGGEEISKKLGMLGNLGLEACKKGLYKVAQQTMTDSKSNYVPVLTGALRGSGHVDLPVVSGNEVSVLLGFGGVAADYALNVHETNKHYNNGKVWKYLETPLKLHSKEILPSVQAELEKILPSSHW